MWILLLLSLVRPAVASSARAELDRLDEDIRVLVDKNAWQGVERLYLQMVPLEPRGAKMSWDQHRWGALAAQARGDVMATWLRLRAAEAVASHEETLVWLATLEATHGRAVVELSPLVFGDVVLEPLDPVVDPAAQKTIALATTTLTQARMYDGLLPLGRYRIGTVHFSIDGGPMVKVRVEPGQGKPKASAEPPGTLRLVASAVPEQDGAYAKAAEAAKVRAAGTPGVASVQIVPLPGHRLYADFAQGSLDVLGLTPTTVAQQVREKLGLRPGDVLPGPDSIAVPVAIGADRLKGVALVFDGGEVTLGSVSRLRDAPDRTAPPPGLLLQLSPGADADTVRTAVLASLTDDALGLTPP